MLWLGALAATSALGQNKAFVDPADPNAPVPPTRYVPMPAASVAAPTTSPAENWKALNQTVAAYDSMSLTMEMAAPAAPAGAQAVAPKPQPAHPTAPASPDVHSHPKNKAVK